MQIYTDVGGRPGQDCGGFCRFCFYRNVDHQRIKSQNLGCTNCPPQQIGCPKCQAILDRVNNRFKPLEVVMGNIEHQIFVEEAYGSSSELKLVIGAGADIFFYPGLPELVSSLKEYGSPLHLGYTCGKAIKSLGFAQDLISRGLDELSFSVFSTNPELRRHWMGDENPREAVESLKLFCENIRVNASAVVIPGVNDTEQIMETCCDLEDWGVDTFVLRRFANYKNQGLILNNDQPLLDDIKPHTYREFQELVRKITEEFSFRVLAFPFYDPYKNFPFAILDNSNRRYLQEIDEITGPATIITSKLAEPYLGEFFNLVDDKRLVNVIDVPQEIADLITAPDLRSLELKKIKSNVVIPRGALVHVKEAREILSRDGMERYIKRGPYVLTHPYYESIDFDEQELIEYEIKSFNKLIGVINSFN